MPRFEAPSPPDSCFVRPASVRSSQPIFISGTGERAGDAHPLLLAAGYSVTQMASLGNNSGSGEWRPRP